MKKLFNIIIVLIAVFTLSSCTLAKDNVFYGDELNNNDDEVGDDYLLSRIDFDVVKGVSNLETLDTADYFYVNFACIGQTVFDNCIGNDVGSSIDVNKTHYHTEVETVNGEEQPIVNTITIEYTFYSAKNAELTIFPKFIYENINGEEDVHPSTGAMIASGLTISGNLESTKSDGSKQILDYTFHFETLDTLERVTVKQFDKDDNLLVTTEITKDNLLDELTLNSNTEYYFILEDYLDEDSNSYQERTYHHMSETTYYLYKYTNEDGFLDGDRLFIHTS